MIKKAQRVAAQPLANAGELGPAPLERQATPDIRCLSDDTILALSIGELAPDVGWTRDAHAAGCEHCLELLSEVVRAHGGRRRRRARPVSSEPRVFECGARVAQRYTVQRLLGQGGMGEVYEVLDERLGRSVALKTARATACDAPEARSWLQHELAWSRRVDHPNVRRMYELGAHVDQDGAVDFLSMELIEGESLGGKLERGPLALEDACAVYRELLLGLAAVHAAGVVHQDVKSDNIILLARDQGRRAVLTDFALATVWHGTARRPSEPRLVGTPAYMTPEQLLGSGAVDAAADVFALGVVFFEMLTAQLPWPRPHEHAAWATDDQHVKQVSQLRPAVPQALERFLVASLSRDPGERPRSALEALSAFERAQPGAAPRAAATCAA
jgi:serine/threonine-protein kinase